MSTETESAREKLAPFCTGTGVDLGFGGGQPIVDWAMTLDRAPGHPHRRIEDNEWPTNLIGDAANLVWFRNESLDFCYSSHVLEDFTDTTLILREWLRVLKIGGKLVMFLPDQKAYLEHCRVYGGEPNRAHKHPDFSLEFVKAKLPREAKVIFELWPFPGNAYSFALVAEKIVPPPVKPVWPPQRAKPRTIIGGMEGTEG